MKIRQDLACALAAICGLMFSFCQLFVAIPAWLHIVVATLTVVAIIGTVGLIVMMRKESLNPDTQKYEYRFPIFAFIIGALFVAGFILMVMLLFKQYYGWAFIPLGVLLVAGLVLALIKGIKVLKSILAIILAIMVIFWLCYGAAWMVKNDFEFNRYQEEVQEPNADDQNPNDDNANTGDDNANTGDDNANTGDDNANTGDDNANTGDDNANTGDDNANTGDGTVKIIAPATATENVPFTIKLEGCKFDDLVFSYTEYLSITKVSDTECTVILVSYYDEVLDQYLLPGSGYVTVKDTVTNTAVEIQIVTE